MASTSWAFFIEPAPEMPRPTAMDLRSASSIELRPPDLAAAFLAGFFAAAVSAVSTEGVSVTWVLRTLRRPHTAGRARGADGGRPDTQSDGPGRAGTPNGA